MLSCNCCIDMTNFPFDIVASYTVDSVQNTLDDSFVLFSFYCILKHCVDMWL